MKEKGVFKSPSMTREFIEDREKKGGEGKWVVKERRH